MAASRYSFDIEIKNGSRWIIDSTQPREHLARVRATALLANPKCAGARIIRTWSRPDGVDVDTEIFCQTREADADTAIRISRVDTLGGTCRTPEDFFGFESRQAMSRIFRDYLAWDVVTPTEILHNLRQLKRIAARDTLLRDAVEMVAHLQTRGGEQTAAQRRDEIYQAVDAMIARAGTIDPPSLPKRVLRFSEAMRSIGAGGDCDRRAYLMLAALSRELGHHRTWLGKLDALCAMAATECGPESEPGALDLLDGVIADVLATDVIDDLLGPKPYFGAEIHALLDLSDGILPIPKTGAGATTASLCGLLAAGRLPASRRCVAARAHRALRLPRALRPNDPAEESAELGKIIRRLATPHGLHSAAETAQALTIRVGRAVEQGGKPGRREAIRRTFLAMPDLARGVFYLCDLARCDFGREHLADMEELFAEVLQARFIEDFSCRGPDIQQLMACATAAYHAVTASPYSPAIKLKIADHIDTLLEQSIVDGNIVEKVDQPTSQLRERAFLLVRFCDSGLLPNGRALTKARARVLALLKQPDFVERFVAEIDDTHAAQAVLRDFFALLKSSGLHSG